jgi:hypothetical protein
MGFVTITNPNVLIIYDYIVAGQVVVVLVNTQYPVCENLSIDGTIQIDGTLCIRD